MNQHFNVYESRVRSHQTDLNAAMYHAAYFDVFDDARIETFRRLNYTYRDAVSGRWSPVIRRVECEYFSPARMDDLIHITVTIPKLTAARMTIRYDCRREEALIAIGHATFVFLDAEGKPMRVPTRLRSLVESEPLLGSRSMER